MREAKPKSPDQSSSNAAVFFAALARGDIKKLQVLLDSSPALANARDRHGQTPLHVAVERYDVPAVKLLLKYPADPTLKYGDSAHSALSWALTVGAFAAAEAIVASGVKPDLFCAAGLGDVKAVKSFFDAKRKLKKNPSTTGSSRCDKDGKRLGLPRTPREFVSDALYMAARCGQADVVRELLKHDPDLSFRAFIGGTALHWAYYSGSRETIDLLIDAEADVNARDDEYQSTPRAFGVNVAAGWGIEKLLDRQLKLDKSSASINEARATPLHEAARNGQVEIVKKLLAADAKPNARDREGRTALEVAQDGAKGDVVKILKKVTTALNVKNSSAKGRVWKPVMDAAYFGEVAKMKSLLKAGADPNIVSGTNHHYRPLHRAIEKKKTYARDETHEQVVELLLKAGADPALLATYENASALHLSAFGETRFVKILLTYWGELDIFHAASVADEKRIAELLKKDKTLARSVDAGGFSALQYAAGSAVHRQSPVHAKALVNIVKKLLAAGADVNATHMFGGTWPIPVLYYACGRSNNAVVARILLEAGANPYDGESVYHASDEGHGECLAVLEEFTEPKKLANQCSNAISGQMHWGNSRGAKWLLEHGADPNHVNQYYGVSALQAAVKNGASDAILEMLKKYGADPRVKSRDGKSALDLAKAGRNSRVLKFVQSLM